MARILEGLSVFASGDRAKFVPNTPSRLRAARTCYDHMAGTLAVSLHDRLHELGWFSSSYELTQQGTQVLESLGIDVDAVRLQRRRFAYACLDWSERRPHIGGALGAAMLQAALKRKWVTQDLDSRVLSITDFGRRELQARFGLLAPSAPNASPTSRRPIRTREPRPHKRAFPKASAGSSVRRQPRDQ